MTTDGVIGPDHPMWQRGQELAGFHVVPRQLAYTGDELKFTGEILRDWVTNELQHTLLSSGDVGLLGKEAKTHEHFNRAAEACFDHFRALSRTLVTAGEEITNVAKHYASLDDEYYRKFGRLDDH